MKDIIKEIPIIIFVGVFSIPIMISNFAHKVINKYIDWVWNDSPKP